LEDLSRADKYRQTMIARYGSYEAFKAHQRELASKGGKNNKPENRAYSLNKELATRASHIAHANRRKKHEKQE
jgi:hypothetical protein